MARTTAGKAAAFDQATQHALLASIVDCTDDAVIGKTLDGTITTWNPAAARLYGYEAEEIIGRSVMQLIPHDRADEMSAILKRIAAGERVESHQTTRLRKDGSAVAVSLTISPIRDGDGRIVGASSIARDITRSRLLDRERLAGAQYARSLIEASLDPLVTISPEGKVTDVNEATVKVTGVPRQGLIGTDFSDYFTEPDEARKGYRRAFAEGSVTDYPLTIRHRDGRLTDVVYNASVYRDAGGRVLGVFAAARDVTAQKAASEYARSLIEASLDPLVTISPEGKVTDVNEATVKVTGVPRQGLIGTDFSDYFTEPDQARKGYRRAFAEGSVTDYPLTIRHRDGRLTDVLYNASVYRDGGGRVLGVFAAARDVTTMNELTAELREANRLATELSTPVIKVWEGMLAIPLIGTLDSTRSQELTEHLLDMIGQTRSSIAIIDITGVPTVDTMVAQHLVKTSMAARLMGADCIISGIRPQIAQTIANLGVSLEVTTKSSLSDALATGLERIGLRIVPRDGR